MSEVRFTAEMTITHRDFLRLLGSAVEGRTYTVAEADGATEVAISDAAGPIYIHLAPERERRIASIRLTVTDVVYRFAGHTQAEADAIKARFEIFFRRGGG